MATFRLRRFSSPEILRAVAPARLLEFLEPYRATFTTLGLDLPDAGATRALDYDRLVDLFMVPEAGLPKDLLDALYLVDEMATPEGMDALLRAARRAGLPLDERAEDTPADVAVQVWIRDRNLLENEHAQQYLYRPRSFECYQTNRLDVPPFSLPSAEVRAQLERDLDEWFVQRNRGRGTRVFVYPREQEVWFLVRHGEPFKREESLDSKGTASVCYRPLKYDVLVYQTKIGELRINARSKGEKEVYRRLVGRHFFGDSELFPGDNKFTLAPLRERGQDALVCVDVPGIEEIKLRELHCFWETPCPRVEIHKAKNLFATFRTCDSTLVLTARLVRAVFQVKFQDSRRPRSVTIRPSNIAQYTRDADAELVEQWLRLRGFILPGSSPEKKEGADATLASA